MRKIISPLFPSPQHYLILTPSALGVMISSNIINCANYIIKIISNLAQMQQQPLIYHNAYCCAKIFFSTPISVHSFLKEIFFIFHSKDRVYLKEIMQYFLTILNKYQDMKGKKNPKKTKGSNLVAYHIYLSRIVSPQKGANVLIKCLIKIRQKTNQDWKIKISEQN